LIQIPIAHSHPTQPHFILLATELIKFVWIPLNIAMVWKIVIHWNRCDLCQEYDVLIFRRLSENLKWYFRFPLCDKHWNCIHNMYIPVVFYLFSAATHCRMTSTCTTHFHGNTEILVK
jgi:hypothetical protein